MGWKSGNAPESFQINGRMVSAPKTMAQILMKLFVNKIQELRAHLPPRRNNPLTTLRNAFTRWKRSGDIPELILKEIDELETFKIMSSMSTSTSFGRDELDSSTIKVTAKYLHKPLKHIINLSITTGVFANKWKMARLIPIFKGKEIRKLNLHPSDQ